MKVKKRRKDGVLQSYNVKPKKLYVSFNYTDGIPGPVPYPMPKKQAKKVVKDFLKAMERNQGYYKTSSGERIPISEVNIKVVPEDFLTQ